MRSSPSLEVPVPRPVPSMELELVPPPPSLAAPPAESAERTVLAALAHGVLLIGIKHGLDPDDLCAAGGFHAVDLADHDRQVPLTWLVSLVRAVRQRVPAMSVELEVVRFSVLDQFGYVGQAIKHEATPLAALRALARWGRLLDSALASEPLEVRVEGDRVELVVPCGVRHSQSWAESLLAGCAALVRALSREPAALREAQVACSALRLDPRVRAYLGVPVSFDAPDSRLVFDRAALERPSLHGDDHASRYFGAQVDKLIDQLDQPFVTLVSRAIAAQLTRGDLSQGRIGRHLALSPRSLQRKLHQHGLKYTTLVEDTRKAAAARLLSDPARSISEVANELGYRDASSFTRVFKRWTGVNPRRYRDRQRSASA
jgi:AraC-like DNA-binding protein